MKQINEHLYEAEQGCFIIRKEDNFIMGEVIDLGTADSIDNYTDSPYTEESYKEFYLSIGMEPLVEKRSHIRYQHNNKSK